MYNNYDYFIFNGNLMDINIESYNCEVRADLVLSKYKSARLWGRVLKCEGKVVKNALIKLVKVDYNCNNEWYREVAQTMSECNGFYQFELYNYDNKSKYKLLVNRSTYGSDTILIIELNDSNTCKEHAICSNNYCKLQNLNLKCNEKHNGKYIENKYNKHEVNYAYKDPKYYYSNKD